MCKERYATKEICPSLCPCACLCVQVFYQGIDKVSTMAEKTSPFEDDEHVDEEVVDEDQAQADEELATRWKWPVYSFFSRSTPCPALS